MAGKIRDEIADWDLSSKMQLGKALAKHAPKRNICVGQVFAESSGATDGAGGRMVLHRRRSTTKLTPPQPLPIKGRDISAQLAVLAAAAVDGRVDHALVALGLAGDAGAHARQGFAALL